MKNTMIRASLVAKIKWQAITVAARVTIGKENERMKGLKVRCRVYDYVAL